MDPPAMDQDWSARAMRQRRANEEALRAGRPLPYPNPWDALDPTKLPRDATPEQIRARVRAFAAICRKPSCKRHVLEA